MALMMSNHKTLLLGALLCLTTACDDDGNGSGGAEGSTSTTSGTSTTDTPTSSTSEGDSDDGTTTVTDPSTSSSTTDDGSTTSGSETTAGDTTEGDTTGTTAVDVPFQVHDPSGLELTARVPEGWVLITTADAWAAFTDTAAPEGVTFPDQWVLFGSRGPLRYPGHALSVETLTWQGDNIIVDGAQVDPAADCDTYDFIWPADTLLSFDAVDATIESIDDLTEVTEAACADGATSSMSCDLDTPCGPDLLCAGIVRSTVLLGTPGGLCLDSSHRGTFSGGMGTIPTDGADLDLTVDVAGLTTVDMDVAVFVELDHPAPEELVLTLTNPDGNEVSVADQQTTPLHPGGVPIVPNGFSGDESVNGTWTLTVRDAVDNDNNGSVQSWNVEIMSRFD